MQILELLGTAMYFDAVALFVMKFLTIFNLIQIGADHTVEHYYVLLVLSLSGMIKIYNLINVLCNT